ncbi:hypothetical protein DH2020_030149 [Rehmannia glutinosa]|uniref:Pentatricopeptide repeat-containing protein n=1 Tax=Rehmannia glutinosa TaxID=99300 RepID=A0ABR0VLM7_REHGL
MRPLPCVKQFTQLLSRVVNLKEYSAAICLFKDICNLGISVNEYTMNIAIDSCCLSNRVNDGFSILGLFFKRGCVPDAFTFSSLLKGLFRENRIIEAQELFQKIVRERLCELDVVTYGIVVYGLCKAGNTAMAIELLRVMEKGSCKPNIHIYSSVIDGLCKNKMIDSALKIFDEMLGKGITPNVVTYNILVCGLCNLGPWREVKLLLKEMIDCKICPDVMTFSTLIDALCKEGLMDEAEDVLHLMMERNVVPNVVSYSALMDGYCLQGRMTEARNVFYSMARKNIAPNINSFNILINGYCKKMKIDDAIHLFREMRLKGLMPNIVTYTTLLQGLFHACRCSSALKLFDELQAARLKPNFHTYSRAIFRDLPSKGLEPDVVTYSILIKGCYQNGLLEEAKDLFLRMEKASLSPEGVTYNVVVQGNLRSGKYDDASKFFEEMGDKGFSIDASTFALLLDLLGTVEHNPTIFKMIQKLAPRDGSSHHVKIVKLDVHRAYCGTRCLETPKCETASSLCPTPTGIQYAVVFTALALGSIGIGGTRFTLATLGASQWLEGFRYFQVMNKLSKLKAQITEFKGIMSDNIEENEDKWHLPGAISILFPNCYGSGKFPFFCHCPPLSLSVFRYFCTKYVANCNSGEKIKHELGNIRGLDNALCLYETMARMRPLPRVKQFNQLLSRVVKLKEDSAAICLFKDICNLGISVDECTMNIAIDSCCLSNRVNYGFSILGWFFKRGCVPNAITFNTFSGKQD